MLVSLTNFTTFFIIFRLSTSVLPDPTTSCGPYKPNGDIIGAESFKSRPKLLASELDQNAGDLPKARASHDTISMVTIDKV